MYFFILLYPNISLETSSTDHLFLHLRITTMSTLRSALDTMSTYVDTLIAHARGRPFLSAIAVGFIPLLSHIIPSYHGFLALGRGGMPYNFLGYMIQAAAQPIGRKDVTSLAPYTNPKAIAEFGAHGRESFIGDAPLPERRGSRPEVPTYVAPQRQITETRDHTVVARMNAILEDLARQNPDLLAIQPSSLEGKDYMALWLKPGIQIPGYLKRSTGGELFHVHIEGSSHTLLNLADAETAIRTEWAQRHMLSGVTLSWTYVMIYAPRDEDELAVWKRFVGAAVGFVATWVDKEANLEGL